MSTEFPEIRLHNNDGSITIKGELVVETSLDWQVATNGTVRAYSKAEYRDTTVVTGHDGSFEDLLGGMFGGRR